MNIYITHNLSYNPFQIYHRQQRCKTIYIFEAATIRAKNTVDPTLFSVAPKCEQRLTYASGGWTRNLHNANKHYITTAHYITYV